MKLETIIVQTRYTYDYLESKRKLLNDCLGKIEYLEDFDLKFTYKNISDNNERLTEVKISVWYKQKIITGAIKKRIEQIFKDVFGEDFDFEIIIKMQSTDNLVH